LSEYRNDGNGLATYHDTSDGNQYL
jgi:aminopeptidase N